MKCATKAQNPSPNRAVKRTLALGVRPTPMSVKVSPPTAAVIGLLLSVIFFFFFAHLIVESASIWAIQVVKPTFEPLNNIFGKGYARALAYTMVFVVGVLGSALFVLPVRLLLGVNLTSISIALTAIAPVMLVTMSNGVPASFESFSLLVQPVVGVALAFVYRQRRPTNDAQSQNPKFSA